MGSGISSGCYLTRATHREAYLELLAQVVLNAKERERHNRRARIPSFTS
jgi:hypothetical protein